MSNVQQVKWTFRKMETLADGADLAARWFGMDEAQIAEQCGRFTRGKNKGKVRGWIVWTKAEIGGWCFPLGCVVRPGMMFAAFCKTYDDAYRVMNLPTAEFQACAKRVDRAYGHDPLAPQVAHPNPTAPPVAEHAAAAFPPANPRDVLREQIQTAMECPAFDGWTNEQRREYINRALDTAFPPQG